jgi:hypothetical protein
MTLLHQKADRISYSQNRKYKRDKHLPDCDLKKKSVSFFSIITSQF